MTNHLELIVDCWAAVPDGRGRKATWFKLPFQIHERHVGPPIEAGVFVAITPDNALSDARCYGVAGTGREYLEVGSD